MAIKTRAFQDSDLNYILKTWVLEGADFNLHKLIKKEVFDADYPRYVNNTLRKDHTYIRVAVDDGDPNFILSMLVYGFDIKKRLVVHFAYTAFDYRGFGLMKRLINDVYGDFDKPIHWTSKWKDSKPTLEMILNKHPSHSYNPYPVLASLKDPERAAE